MEKNHLVADILSSLGALGQSNAVSADALAVFAGFKVDCNKAETARRELRRAVAEERAAGVQILSGRFGYCLPSSNPAIAATECRRFYHRQQRRAKSSFMACRCFRAAAQVDGQIGIEDWLRGEVDGVQL